MLASACSAVGNSTAACSHGAMQGNAFVWYAGLNPVHLHMSKAKYQMLLPSHTASCVSSQCNARLSVQGVKGVACIWRANEDFVDKYNLALELPTDLVSFTSMYSCNPTLVFCNLAFARCFLLAYVHIFMRLHRQHAVHCASHDALCQPFGRSFWPEKCTLLLVRTAESTAVLAIHALCST